MLISTHAAKVQTGKWIPIEVHYEDGTLRMIIGSMTNSVPMDEADVKGYLAIAPHKMKVQIRKFPCE